MSEYIALPSPNFDSREGQAVDMLVLHYTGMKTGSEARQRLCDAQAKVSAHYVVEEDGRVFALVDESKRAWHAGVSYWRGHTNINQRSIGIEMVNPGHEFGYRAFPQTQMEAVAKLCQGILSRHAIEPRNVVAHSDIAPARKEDPGELFDWKWLAEQGIGLWHASASPLKEGSRDGGDPATHAKRAAQPHPNPRPSMGGELEEYGYDTANLQKAITAFQRHFRPKSLSGAWDEECAQRLAGLLGMV